MNKLSKAVIAALLFGGSVSAANAVGVITGVTASGLSEDSFSFTLDSGDTVNISKVLDSFNPVTLTFTVVGQVDAGGNNIMVTEHVTNNTGQTWTGFHYSLAGFDEDRGFTQVVFGDFSLDTSTSNQHNLNWTGSLASGDSADAQFFINAFDPGVGNTATFTITQTPSPIPEPETYAMMFAGLLLVGSIAKRRNNKT
ncbi:MAG: motif putative anchor domain protein [Nitrosospira multiformis]|jgi:hypothetical protein|nr:motif putative anchor domain protein [Nitrosospira multiformis]